MPQLSALRDHRQLPAPTLVKPLLRQQRVLSGANAAGSVGSGVNGRCSVGGAVSRGVGVHSPDQQLPRVSLILAHMYGNEPPITVACAGSV